MRKKAVISILLMIILVLCSCGSTSPAGSSDDAGKTEVTEEAQTNENAEDIKHSEPAEKAEEPSSSRKTESEKETETEQESTPESEAFTGDPVKLQVAVSSYNKTDIKVWELAAESLLKQGVELEVVPVDPADGGVVPAMLENQDIGLCSYGYFWSLDPEAAEKLCPVGYTTMSPMHLYSDSLKNLEDLKDGDEILIPFYHCERPLKLLAEAGLITLKEEMPDLPVNWSEEAEAFIEAYVESYLTDIKIKVYDMSLKILLPEIMEKNHNIVLYESDFYSDVMIQYMSRFSAIFEDPLTDEDWMSTILARTEDMKDPEKLDVFEKAVEAWQSETTIEYYKSINLLDKPAGWDIDLISRYR